MSTLEDRNANQPVDAVVRRPMDGVWFAVLFVSIALGIGMTIVAPVGDVPPAGAAPDIPSPATTAISPATIPATDPAAPAAATSPT